jgi:hypothetical protein
MEVEQRKYVRFWPKQSLLAALGNKHSTVGKVVDISIGGLSFEYIIGEELNINASRLDIFSVGSIFQLFNIPCKVIYNIDVHVPHVKNRFIKALTTGRCGLKFDVLPKSDFCHLKIFVESNTARFFK